MTYVQYVRPDIVDTWRRDSSESLVGRVYTHFTDKFMTNQMDLVQFEFKKTNKTIFRGYILLRVREEIKVKHVKDDYLCVFYYCIVSFKCQG